MYIQILRTCEHAVFIVLKINGAEKRDGKLGSFVRKSFIAVVSGQDICELCRNIDERSEDVNIDI